MTWPVILPLAGALLAYVFPRHAARVTVGTAAATLAIDVGLARAVFFSGPAEHRLGGWTPPLGIRLQLDGPGVLFLLLTGVVFLAASVYATRFFAPPADRRSGRERGPAPRDGPPGPGPLRGPPAPAAFWPLWLFVLAALDGLFLTADLFNMYVALELLTLAAVALVALTNDGPGVQAAIRYLLAGLVASLFFLLGVSLLYSEYGVLDLAALGSAITPGRVTAVAVPLVIVGLAVKTALFPFHFWLPPAHGSAFAPVSAVLSGLVVKGPFFLLFRLMLGPFSGVVPGSVTTTLGVLGLLGIAWGSVRALQQPRLKLLIAYSTVAQIGYLFLMFSLAAADPSGPAVRGGLFYALSHGCAKAAMFLAAGAIVRGLGHDRIADLGAAGRGAPLATVGFALAGVGVMGFPASGGFVGKWLLGESAVQTGQWWALVGLIAGGLLAAAYIFRVLRQAFVAAPEAGGLPPGRAPRGMEWPTLALAAISVLLGLATALPMALLP